MIEKNKTNVTRVSHEIYEIIKKENKKLSHTIVINPIDTPYPIPI